MLPPPREEVELMRYADIALLVIFPLYRRRERVVLIVANI